MLEKGRIDDVDLAHLRAIRVAVALDVLAQLRTKKYVASGGTYVMMQGRAIGEELQDRERNGEENPTLELQDVLPKLPPCDVCAIGASVLSYARLFDNTPIGVTRAMAWGSQLRITYEGDGIIGAPEFLAAKLGAEFSGTIEMVFEGWDVIAQGNADLADVECSPNGLPGGAGYDGSADRMRWIMRNVIANGGVFLHKTVTGQVEY